MTLSGKEEKNSLKLECYGKTSASTEFPIASCPVFQRKSYLKDSFAKSVSVIRAQKKTVSCTIKILCSAPLSRDIPQGFLLKISVTLTHQIILTTWQKNSAVKIAGPSFLWLGGTCV